MRPDILRGLLLTAALLAFAPAAGAGAATFTPADGTELDQALVTAAGNAQDDTVVLDGATTYTRAGGFAYSTGTSNKLTIVGNGATVTATGSGLILMALDGGTVEVSGLKVQAVPTFAYGFVARYSGTTARLDDIAVSGQTTNTGASYGIYLTAGSVTATNLRSSALASQGIYSGGTSVTLTGATVTGASNRQVQIGGGTAVLTDLDIHDPASPSANGIEAETPGTIATVRRARVAGSSPAAAAYFSGNLTLTDSLLLLSTPSGRGLTVGDNNNSFGHSSSIDARRVTIVGTGASGQLAASAGDGNPPTGADHHTITLSDSIVSNIPNQFACTELDAAATNSVTVDTTALPAGGTNSDTCADGAPDPGIALGAGITNLAPAFADAAAGDYRQLYTSPLLDLGAATDPLTGADLGGGLRFVNAAIDLGAYEYQRAAPQVTVGGSPSPTMGKPVTLTATATDVDPGETAQLTYAWTFSDGGTATGASAQHVFQLAGDASATVKVTDPTGLTTSKDLALTIVAPQPPPVDTPAPAPAPAPGPGPATPAATAPDRTAPKLSSLRMAKTIHLGPKLPGAVTRGGQVRFTLSEAATVTVRFERKVGKRVVRVPGSVKLKLAAGKRSVRFTGRVTKKLTLKPGPYRIVLTATDAAGNTGRVVRASFTLQP